MVLSLSQGELGSVDLAEDTMLRRTVTFFTFHPHEHGPISESTMTSPIWKLAATGTACLLLASSVYAQVGGRLSPRLKNLDIARAPIAPGTVAGKKADTTQAVQKFDLAITNFQGAVQGSQYRLSATIQNIGQAPYTSGRYAYLYVINPYMGSTMLRREPLPVLQPGQTYVLPMSVDIATVPSNWFSLSIIAQNPADNDRDANHRNEYAKTQVSEVR